MRAAYRLARALGCNIMPTSLEREPYLAAWPGWNYPDSTRCWLEVDMMRRWREREARELRAGREQTAWALLPGSGRIVVVDCDGAGWAERWLERLPTPLVVRSPTPGRAHLYYREPDGVDVGSRGDVAGKDTYEIKARGAGSIHAPGSLHHRRQGRYACSLPPEEQVQGLRERLPVLDLAIVGEDERLRPGRPDAWRCDHGEERWDTTGEGARRWAAYLKATPSAQSGGRQKTLFRLARKAGDFGQDFAAALPGLLAWAAACEPPLEDEDVRGALRRAYDTRVSQTGCDLTPEAEDITVDV